MGGLRGGVRRALSIAGLVLALLFTLAACEYTPLLGKVRELVLTGAWDEAIFDTSIFGE